MNSQLPRITNLQAIGICALMTILSSGASVAQTQPTQPKQQNNAATQAIADLDKALAEQMDVKVDQNHGRWTQSALTQMEIDRRVALITEASVNNIKTDPIVNPTPDYYESLISNHRNAIAMWKKTLNTILNANQPGGLQLMSPKLSLIYVTALRTVEMGDRLFKQSEEAFRPSVDGSFYLCAPYDRMCSNKAFAPAYKVYRHGYEVIKKYILEDGNHYHVMRRLYAYRGRFTPPVEFVTRVRNYVYDELTWFKREFQIESLERDGRGNQVKDINPRYNLDVYRVTLSSLLESMASFLRGETGDPGVLLFGNIFVNEEALITALQLQLQAEISGNSVFGTMQGDTSFLLTNKYFDDIILFFQGRCGY